MWSSPEADPKTGLRACVFFGTGSQGALMESEEARWRKEGEP